jgi:hypothetical protein
MPPSRRLHHAGGFDIVRLPAHMQSIVTALNMVIADPSDALERKLGVLHGPLEIRFVPHGQRLRPPVPWRPQRSAAVPQGRSAEESGSLKTDVHGQQ